MAFWVAIFSVEEMRGVQLNSHRNFMALPTLYTPSEVADKLKVNRRSVYQWLNRGYLHGLKARQSWRITEEDLTNFMQERPVTPEQHSPKDRHP